MFDIGEGAPESKLEEKREGLALERTPLVAQVLKVKWGGTQR